MSWDKEPPKDEELIAATTGWDAEPPTELEITDVKEPYYNPVEKAGMAAGKYIADSKVGKGLQWVEKNVTNPARDWFLDDVVGIEGDGKRSFKELFEHEDGLFSAKTLAEHFPERFSSDPDEYKKWLTWKKDGAFDQSPGSAMGNIADMTIDPVNAIPVGMAARGAGRVLKSGATKLDDMARISKTLGKFKKAAGKTAKKGFTKASSSMTGVPERAIETYIDQTDLVDDLIHKTGGDVTELADDMRRNWQTGVRARKSILGKKVDKTLSKSDELVDVNPLLDEFDELKRNIDPITQPEDMAAIMEMENMVKAKAAQGNLFAKDMNNIKKALQKKAKGSYIKDGQIFTPGAEQKRFARLGARRARKLTEAAEPSVAGDNRQLSKLHTIEEKINKNLLAEGKPEASVISAGSHTHKRNLSNLQKLSDASGMDMVGDAEKLAAAKYFGNPSLMPQYTTGKSVLATGAPAAVGWAVGGPAGGAIAASMSSPMMLKVAIKTGKLPMKLFKQLSGGADDLTRPALEQAIAMSKTKAGQEMIKQSLRGVRRKIQTNYKDGSGDWFAENEDGYYADNDAPEFLKHRVDDEDARDQYLKGN